MNEQRNDEPGTRRDDRPAETYIPDDEISLFDLWAVLYRRRWQMLVVFVVAVGLAGLFALVRTPAYGYDTGIEIGSYLQGSGDSRNRVLIEQPPVIRQKLENAYIRLARRELESAGIANPPAIDVSTQDQSSIFVLGSQAGVKDADTVERFHRAVVDRLVADHRDSLRIVRREKEQRLEAARNDLAFIEREAVRASRTQPAEQRLADARRRLEALATDYESEVLALRNELEAATRELADLVDENELLTATRERLGRAESLLKEQLTAAEDLLADLSPLQREATSTASGSTDALVLLTVGSQIESVRQRVDDLEQRLHLELPAERDEIHKQIADNERAQADAKSAIAELEKDLEAAKTTYQRERGEVQAAIADAETGLEKTRAEYEQEVEGVQRRVDAAEASLSEIFPTTSLYVALRDTEPQGPSLAVVLTLGAVLGAMMAVFAAFILEFVVRANQHVAAAREE